MIAMISNAVKHGYIPKNFKNFYKRTTQIVKNLFERSPNHDYFLKKKESGAIYQFPNDSWAISNGAVSYKTVIVGKHNDPNFVREITTFFDVNDRPITQYFNDNNAAYQAKHYKYSNADTFNNKSAKVREISTEVYMHNKLNELRFGNSKKAISHFGRWRTVQNEIQCLTDMNNGSKKLSILKRSYPLIDNKRRISVVEYPAKKVEPNNAKKELNIDIMSQDGILNVVGLNKSDNVLLPNDNFLPYRFLTVEEKCQELPKYYLSRYNLHDMGIGVKFELHSKKSGVAYFSPEFRKIAWLIKPDNYPIARISAHEARHAFQHAQIGRCGLGFTDYEIDCKYRFGKIKNKNRKKIAEKYSKATDEYPLDNDIDYISKYKSNYLEIDARSAGGRAEKEYNVGRDLLASVFGYFPKLENMF